MIPEGVSQNGVAVGDRILSWEEVRSLFSTLRNHVADNGGTDPASVYLVGILSAAGREVPFMAGLARPPAARAGAA